LIPGDSFINISQVTGRLKKMEEKAFFYIDPPFSIREGHEEIYNHMIKLVSSLEQSVVRMIIIEHMTGLELPDKLGPYEIRKTKKFGKTSLSYFD
jgi:16S rRNA G966 N2-methylase RsmD